MQAYFLYSPQLFMLLFFLNVSSKQIYYVYAISFLYLFFTTYIMFSSISARKKNLIDHGPTC
jgi:hypothetical protein